MEKMTILSVFVMSLVPQIWFFSIPPITAAFTIPIPMTTKQSLSSSVESCSSYSNQRQHSFFQLENMKNDDSDNEADDTNGDSDDSDDSDNTEISNNTDDLESTTSTDVVVDPMIMELQEQIKNMEAQIKGKKSMLERLQDDLEKYSKTGYARQVAQMEDMKRIRLSMQSSNKDSSQANVVQNFLVIWDELTELKENNDDSSSSSFGIKYHGLVDSLASTMRGLGVQSYDAIVGDVIDPVRVTILDREYSDLYAPNTILYSSQPGLELRGNVLRLAQAIVSKGPEAILEPSKEESNPEDVKEEEVV